MLSHLPIIPLSKIVDIISPGNRKLRIRSRRLLADTPTIQTKIRPIGSGFHKIVYQSEPGIIHSYAGILAIKLFQQYFSPFGHYPEFENDQFDEFTRIEAEATIRLAQTQLSNYLLPIEALVHDDVVSPADNYLRGLCTQWFDSISIYDLSKRLRKKLPLKNEVDTIFHTAFTLAERQSLYIHEDILHPWNILYNTNTGELKICECILYGNSEYGSVTFQEFLIYIESVYKVTMEYLI